MPRPAGVEGWLPIAGLMNLKYWLCNWTRARDTSRSVVPVHRFLAMAFLLRKAFCSWLCPVGTLSEYLWRAGRKIFRRNFQTAALARSSAAQFEICAAGLFRLGRYANMSAGAVEEFMRSPYGAIADVRMLNFFRYLGETAAIVLAASGARFAVGAEFLVPLSVPLRGACSASLPCSARCAYGGRNRLALTAPSAPRRAHPPCPWTN